MIDASFLLFTLRFILIFLVVGLGFVSFRAYYRKPSDRLATVFLGFAFISMAVAGSTITGHLNSIAPALKVLGLVGYTIGFSMFYFALYR